MYESDINRETNEALFQQIVEEIWSGDLSAYDEIFAADAIIHTPFETFTDRTAYRAYVEESIEIVPDFRVELHDVLSEGDTVAGRFTQRGTQTGAAPRMQLPATGRAFVLPGANFARFNNGRCVEMWTIWDKMEFVEQLGLLPDSPTKIFRLMIGQLKNRLSSRSKS